MKYGVCDLSIVPLRFDPKDTSEMVSQVLYGEHFEIVEQNTKWSKIKLAFDDYEGWIDNKQYVEITEKHYHNINNLPLSMVNDMVEFIITKNEQLISVLLGSSLAAVDILGHKYEGKKITGKQPKEKIIETALLFLNAPYLWGGKTLFGIDCSGFSQIVYKLNGYVLLRDAAQQATQGLSLSFLEESEPGDLAFFDNDEGKITHVGIIIEDNHIIHAHGKVRIDRIDHTGIYNLDKQTYTHKLRVIKRIV